MPHERCRFSWRQAPLAPSRDFASGGGSKGPCRDMGYPSKEQQLATDHVACSAGCHALSHSATAPSSQLVPTAMRRGTGTCGVCGHPWLVTGQRRQTCVDGITHCRAITCCVQCGALLTTDEQEELVAKCIDSKCHALLFWLL